MSIFDDRDEEFNLEEIQARQDALEAELAGWEDEPEPEAAEKEGEMEPETAEEEDEIEPETAEEESEPEPDEEKDSPDSEDEEPEASDVLVMEDYGGQESDWEAVLEAVLFTMGRPVELYQLAVAIGQDKKIARQTVERLQRRYDLENRGMEIIRLEDSYQMCTRGKYYENLIRVASVPKKHVLTDVILETLSIIAYKQPVTRMEIEQIRGVKSDHAVNRLIEYDLVQEVGRLDAPGRPALFATTDEFLRRFGIGSAANLPDMDPVKLEEMRSQVEEELQVDLEEIEVETEDT